MPQFKSSILYSIIICLLILSDTLFAGREAEYSDRYPKFTKIVQTDTSIIFAGAWLNRYIIAERNMDGRWQLFSSIGKKYPMYYAHIFEIPEGLLFMSVDGNYKKFIYKFKTWVLVKSKAERASYNKLFYNPPKEYPDLNIKNIIQNLKIPLPSYNAFKRWRFFPNAAYHLEANIGSYIKKDNAIWFLIDFYDGEGSTGIGGLSVYDYKKYKLGVIRDKILASCSNGILKAYGDTLIIATNISSEYGTYGDHGIVLVDLKRGLLANIPKAGNQIDGDYFLALHIMDDVLWITTDRSIISWDIKHDVWQTFKIESLFAPEKCPVYRRAISYSDFSNGGLPKYVDYDSSFIVSYFNPGDIIKCTWPSSDLAEIISNKEISGWMSKDKYFKWIKRMGLQRIPRYPLEILYSDSTLKRPYHSFLASQITKAVLYENTVFLTINGAWISIEDVEPMLDASDIMQSPLVSWRNILTSADNIKNQAFLTFEEEQEEIKSKIPLLDTTLTITDTMDLFDNFYRLIDVRWLPSNKFDGNQSPQGIKINFNTELWIKENKLQYNGNLVSIGDTINAVEGDAYYTYTILDYKVDKFNTNQLKELKLNYTLVMIPSREW